MRDRWSRRGRHTAVGSRRAGSVHRPATLLFLILLLAALTPFAYASPPDPVWVPGIYDGGDYDDVVEMVTGASWVVAPPAVVVGCAGALWWVPAPAASPVVVPALLAIYLRSPPA